ncbi:MAG: hypothetical protein JNG83_01255 [Opitutaceae bacterium]|nr:hypothetical protein [Opitutaceae bacterium]
MADAPQQRSPLARAGWLVGVFALAWIGFLFLPMRRPQPPESSFDVVVPTSKLRAVGLPDNPDLEGLPDFFEVWASRAEWRDERTEFAYWNPAAKDYSYTFEATRTPEGYRFRPIPVPDPAKRFLDEVIDDDYPIRFYRTLPDPASRRD